MLLGEVEPRHIASVIATMRARKPTAYAEATIDNVVAVIRALYRLARSRGYVTRSPVDGLDPAELPKPRVGGAGRVLDEVELSALVRAAATLPAAYRAGVTLLAYSGLRLSEALGLRWCDVDLVENELTVRTGTPLNHRNLAVRGAEAAAKAAGLGKVTPKDLRASFCSLAGRRRVDPVEAAQLTGHSLNVWTRHYAGSFGKEQRDEARARMLEHGFGELVEADNDD